MRKIKIHLKKVICLSFLLTGSFIFAAKTKTPVMPDWINTPATVYPSSSYITYVGYGADRDSAEIKALQGIASVFGQSIKSDSESSQRMIQAKSEGKIATTNISSFNQNILRSVDVNNLIGVEIKEFWFDGTSSWYAIAVLDKSKAFDIYNDMIKKNAAAISTILENNADDLNSFDGYAAYDFAEDIAVENENHLKKISVIKPDSVSTVKSYCVSSKELHAKKIEIAKNIPICISVENDVDGKLTSAFSESTASLGFRSTDDKSARYILSATVHLERSDTSDGKTTRCRYNISTYILDFETNQQLAPFTATGREGHISYEEAKNRAIKSAEAKIRKDFKKSFSDYLKTIVVE